MNILLGYGNSLVRDFIRDHMAKNEADMTLLTAGTLRETVQLAAQATKLDVIGLDLELSDMEGLTGFETMRTQVPTDIPIALIGPLRPSDEIRDMLQKGRLGICLIVVAPRQLWRHCACWRQARPMCLLKCYLSKSQPRNRQIVT